MYAIPSDTEDPVFMGNGPNPVHLFSTLLILIFALLVCVLSGFSVGYFQNIWSDTAWFTAYGGALNESAPIEITLIET